MTKNQMAPATNPVPSFWNADPRPLDDFRSTEDLPSEIDILIIGSGIAGVGTAYHLLQDSSFKASIAILEARKPVSGATGRNGGHVKPDGFLNVPRTAKIYGAAAAAELAKFEAAHVYAVKDLVEREGLDCDFNVTRALDVFLDPGHAKQTEEAYKELVKANVVDLHDIAFTPMKDAERVSGVKGAQCCFSYTAAHLWPSKMIHQLLQLLLDKGVKLYSHTPVSSVSPTPDNNGAWTVTTPRGVIKARKIIYATNGYTSNLLPEYSRCIVPIRGIACHISSPKGTDTPHLVNTYGIRFDARNNDYLIPRPDGSIIVGGARQRFWHNKERWYGTIRDDELVDEAVSYFDDYMQRHFRGWENSGAKVESIWTGIMGYSGDFMPHVGEIPDKPGQFIIAGFTGHGMPQILLSSKGMAAMVRDGAAFENSGLPRIFKTTKARISSKRNLMEESLEPLWKTGRESKL
ncbi:hypothetical protein CEP51_010188 [Fusarium floridanum]|uniref:FAD dependent oxidoreductase domain-containing protein n=1 Tax=Fusarium floridanum TaxID=1325733 RepID=A0A428RF99_9HYPO|nr:hypothetical protein CEP51_010188 [Fusarium floridanum]